MRIICGTVVVALVAGAFVLGQVWAQEGKAGKDDPGLNGMSMPAWMSPTQEHADLKKSVGRFEVTGTYWMAPDTPGQEMTATAERKTILNDLFLVETFRAEFMGMPYEGKLIQGYDTFRKEHVSIWMDSMNPVMSISRGSPADGVLVLHGEGPCCMTGKLVPTRIEVRPTEDGCEFAMHMGGPDGKMYKSMEMTYRLAPK